MDDSRRRFLQSSLAASLALGAGRLLTACGDDDDGGTETGSGNGSNTTERELRELKALMPFPLFLSFIADVAAVSGGFLPEEGINLDLQFAQSAPQALQQLAAGNVTVIRNAPIAVVRSVSQENAPFRAIAMVNQNIIYILVTTPDSEVAGIDDLQGRTVGLATLGGNAEDTLDGVLRAQQIDLDSVERQAVGNEATAYALVEEGRVDAIFSTREAAASMEAAGLGPKLIEIEDANPLLGTAVVTTQENIENDRDLLVPYLSGLHAAMRAVIDDQQLDELIPKIREEWELPQLDDPESAKPVIEAITGMWLAAGEENLLLNVPERWEEGVEGFKQARIASPDSQPTDFYTNDLVDEALA
jgi:NitT/TauT family transport system substrate-binding protein